MTFEELVENILQGANVITLECAPLDNENHINIFKNALNQKPVHDIVWSHDNFNFEQLVQMLGALQGTKVDSIVLTSNKLGDKTAAELAQMLGALQGSMVTTLYFSVTNLGAKTGMDLAQMLGALQGTEVSTISLQGNNLGRKTGLELTQMLGALHDTKVVSIDLSWNDLNNRTGEELAQMLRALQGTNLTAIDLSLNHLGDKTGAELAQMLGALRDTNITEIHLDFNDFQRKTGAELAQMFAALQGTKVTNIGFGSNNLALKTGADLAQMLGALQHTNITSIDLSINNFGQKTGTELAEMLGALQGSEVITINLTGNSLSRRTGTELAAMLGAFQGTDVLTIDVSANMLGEKTGAELAEMFGGLQGTKLTTVNLAYNRLGYKTGAEFVQMFSALQDTNVTTIDLQGNNLDNKQTDELFQILNTIPNIRVLGVDDDYRFVAHNLLIDLKKIMQDSDDKYEQMTVKLPGYFIEENLHLLAAHLKENYGSLGCFASGLLLSNIITKQQAKQTPTPPEVYREAIDLLLASTTNPTLLNFVRNNLIELKLRMENDVSTHPDYAALKQHYTYVENLIDAKFLKFASLIEGVEDTAPRNPGFYFARQGRMDWERENRNIAIEFLKAYGFEQGNVNPNNAADLNPMMQAIAVHDYEMCLRLYYFLDANLDVVNQNNETLLHLALKHYQGGNKDSEKIIIWLIEMGGDIKATDNEHITPMDIAKEKGCEHLLACACKLSSDEEEPELKNLGASIRKRLRL